MRAGSSEFECSIDDTAAPLLLYVFSGQPSNPTSVQRNYLDYGERNYQRYPLMAEVLDMTHMQLPSPAVREYITAWMAIHFGTIRQHCVASASVVRNLPMRWVLAGWFKLQPPPAQNYRVFSNTVQAIHWAATKLKLAGVELAHKQLEALLSKVKYRQPESRLAS